MLDWTTNMVSERSLVSPAVSQKGINSIKKYQNMTRIIFIRSHKSAASLFHVANFKITISGLNHANTCHEPHNSSDSWMS